MKNIVNTKWLKDHINCENIKIFDCRFNLQNEEYGIKSFQEEHIKNSIYMDLNKDLAGERGIHGGRHPLPNMMKFKELLESYGVDNKSIIVAYDDGDLPGASRLWWMMKYIGLSTVYVLEGGIKAWIKDGYETENYSRTCYKKSSLNVNIQSHMLSIMEDVKKAIDNNNIAIVDSRAKERYLGIVEPVDKKAGHIKGAKNFDWQENFKNGEIISKEDISNRFEKLRNFNQVIVHCGSGVTGCVNVLFLDEADIESKLYLGSWSDWCSYDDNEVVTGEK